MTLADRIKRYEAVSHYTAIGRTHLMIRVDGRAFLKGKSTMTKRVRIENADTSDHKLTVQTWQKDYDGEPDSMVGEQVLNNPTDLCDVMVWQDQYLVVKEVQ